MSRRVPPKKRKKRPGEAKKLRSIGGEVLDVDACARFLGTSPYTVRARKDRGLLPYHRWGGRVVFIRTELVEFFEKLNGVSVSEALENIANRQE